MRASLAAFGAGSVLVMMASFADGFTVRRIGLGALGAGPDPGGVLDGLGEQSGEVGEPIGA